MNRPDPRMIMRDAIAAKIHAFDCRECGGEGEPRFTDEQMAEKVMELFPDVVVEETYVGERGTWPTVPSMATHTRYVLRTDVSPGTEFAEEPK